MMTLDRKPALFSKKRVAAGLSLNDVAAAFSATLAIAGEWEHGISTPPVNVIRLLETIEQYGSDGSTGNSELHGKAQ